jgi:hypothetical protein
MTMAFVAVGLSQILTPIAIASRQIRQRKISARAYEPH